ncbi:MAG: hypothetical protein WCF67_09995 [Chitinophagaceae bacterium]
MPSPQITWCAQSSMHYIVESSTRYTMPLVLAIQLKDHLKKCIIRNCSNCVEEWVSGLDPEDRMLVQIMTANPMKN